MLSNDANILKIKHEILYQVAKLAYAGQLEEKKEELPYELLPGPQAKYRCCVYKEREVVRQRIRLAEGKCPSETPKTGKDNVGQVIEAACADCPLSHYIVTVVGFHKKFQHIRFDQDFSPNLQYRKFLPLYQLSQGVPANSRIISSFLNR